VTTPAPPAAPGEPAAGGSSPAAGSPPYRSANLLPEGGRTGQRADEVVATIILGIEYAIVASLLLVSGVVLVRTVIAFVKSTGGFPEDITPALDGILVVIILLDIVHTVFRHLRDAAFPIRPFLVIGILAGVRDILSASAHLTIGGNLSTHNFNETLVELGVGVGVVVALLVGLMILGRSGHPEDS
jgi:uncharacterized membrane protein (DUF373 family)